MTKANLFLLELHSVIRCQTKKKYKISSDVCVYACVCVHACMCVLYDMHNYLIKQN